MNVSNLNMYRNVTEYMIFLFYFILYIYTFIFGNRVKFLLNNENFKIGVYLYRILALRLFCKIKMYII